LIDCPYLTLYGKEVASNHRAWDVLAGVSNNVVKLKALLVVSILIIFFEGGLLCVEN
jgi:hypothetical protein